MQGIVKSGCKTWVFLTVLLRGYPGFNPVSQLFSSSQPGETGLKPPLGDIPGIKPVKRRGFIWDGVSACFNTFCSKGLETGLKQG